MTSQLTDSQLTFLSQLLNIFRLMNEQGEEQFEYRLRFEDGKSVTVDADEAKEADNMVIFLKNGQETYRAKRSELSGWGKFSKPKPLRAGF